MTNSLLLCSVKELEITTIVETQTEELNPGATTQKELSQDGAGVKCLTVLNCSEFIALVRPARRG